jgi:pyridoxal phosphate enzyme (YggS family)
LRISQGYGVINLARQTNPIGVGVGRIASNYQQVLQQIDEIASQAGRDPNKVRLVVVTKGHSVDQIQEVLEAGASLMGENYLEEAAEKIQALAAYPVEWHMIGHVQSRKAKQVCEQFAWVQSIDRMKIAARLNSCAAEMDKVLPVLMECNVSGEISKFGWNARGEADWAARLDDFKAILRLSNLKVCGLMTMAPYFDDAELARPYFQMLRRFQGFLQENIPQSSWGELSMGMSGDYQVAVQEGATIVRIGTAIMGPRPV